MNDKNEYPRGTEHVLLVEDDLSVRRLAAEILNRLGYSLIIARDSEEAESICEELETPVELIITDIIMPGKNGDELFEVLKKKWEDLKCLYISGYPETAMPGNESSYLNAPFLQKPFRPQALAQKVREVIDQ